MYTLENLFEQDKLRSVNRFVGRLKDVAASTAPDLPDNVELSVMLDVKPDDLGNTVTQCFYYLAHPNGRLVFWLNHMPYGNIEPTNTVTDLTDLSK